MHKEQELVSGHMAFCCLLGGRRVKAGKLRPHFRD